ncbi:xylulose kinase [Lysinibacillus contaminans]|uniref:Xylulose kinase n=1 Tax=Lysinibacillus contaminans TaxID=1293441 RepID=A0ABR5K1V2_9BACI|nr:xylulokinase [Lysinibacillus contaminans]KOS68354.1 xylulose kinase [Lysinibacillus contaminans]
MQNVVLGIDLGTSSVKIVMLNKQGELVGQCTQSYPLIEVKDNFVEQDPGVWVEQTIRGIEMLLQQVTDVIVEGISFSGQMHGLVMLSEQLQPLRNAILWNDTRTTSQCRLIKDTLGEKLYSITKNDALEGFTLPKLLWVKEHEPNIYEQLHMFVLPKDYLRFKLTGELCIEPSDAAGTLLFDMDNQSWSKEICASFNIPQTVCPPLVTSDQLVGYLLPKYKELFSQNSEISVYAGGADNACGALGAGIVNPRSALVSIGTSGVVLTPSDTARYVGNFIHSFSYLEKFSNYIMGVTLAAGESLRWYKSTFAPNLDFDNLLHEIEGIPIGSNGLLYTPYLFGERTPYGDANIRASFIGIKNTHHRSHFTRAIVEGITFSLKQCFDLLKEQNNQIEQIVCIGGAVKNEIWLQIVADIFGMPVSKLTNEQGPALGAAMIAGIGVGWFESYEQAVSICVETSRTLLPNMNNHQQYTKYFECYKLIYSETVSINDMLKNIVNEV